MPHDMGEQLTVQYMGYGVEPDPDVLIRFVPAYSIMKRNLDFLYEDCDAVVFLFESAILMAQVEIDMVDAKQAGEFRWSAVPLTYENFKPIIRKGLNEEAPFPPLDVFRKKMEITPHIFEAVGGGMSQMLLNVTQSCSHPANRKKISFTFAEWMIRGGTVDDLMGSLESVKLNPEMEAMLRSWVVSKAGHEAQRICAKLGRKLMENSGHINYVQLTKGTSIAPFDLRYLVNQIKMIWKTDRVEETSEDMHKRRLQWFKEARKQEKDQEKEDDERSEKDRRIEIE